MAEADNDRKARLEALEAKLVAKRQPEAEARHQEEHYSQAQIAWRMVIELVAGLGIGFLMGYGLDLALGTLPVFMIIFIGLGFAAGVKTMMNTAKEMQVPDTTGKEERD